MVRSLFVKDKIVVNKVAELMDIRIIDARKQVKRWANDEGKVLAIYNLLSSLTFKLWIYDFETSRVLFR